MNRQIEISGGQLACAGDRIELHPATDWWMRGARYGVIIKTVYAIAYVQLDHGRRIRVDGQNILRVVE